MPSETILCMGFVTCYPLIAKEGGRGGGGGDYTRVIALLLVCTGVLLVKSMS